MALSVVTCSVHEYPKETKSISRKRCSPLPNRTGAMAICSSSINSALRYCRMVFTPPPSLSILHLARVRESGQTYSAPKIHAPIFSKPLAAKSLSGPASPFRISAFRTLLILNRKYFSIPLIDFDHKRSSILHQIYRYTSRSNRPKMRHACPSRFRHRQKAH